MAETHSVLAGWGGNDLVLKMSEEAMKSPHNKERPSCLKSYCFAPISNTAEAMDFLRSQHGDALMDWLTIDDPFEFELIRRLCILRREKQSGLFLLVYVASKGTYSLRFRSFKELTFMSAAFDVAAPTELLQYEEWLLMRLVEYKAASGWICTLNEQVDLTLLEQCVLGEHKLMFHTTAVADAVQVISGSFAAMCSALLLHHAMAAVACNNPMKPPARTLADWDSLEKWWNSLEPNTRRSILPGDLSLKAALTSIFLGEDSTLLEEVLRCRSDLTSAALLREVEQEEHKLKRTTTTKKKRKHLTVTTSIVPSSSSMVSGGDSSESISSSPPSVLALPSATLAGLRSRGSSSDFASSLSDEDACKDGDDAWETVSKRSGKSSRPSSTPRRSKLRAASLLMELNPETRLPVPVEAAERKSERVSDRKAIPSPLALSTNRTCIAAGEEEIKPQEQFAPVTANDDAMASIVSTWLHNDITEMARALDLVAMRRQPWQLAIAERVKQVVYSIWPRAWVDVFGSIASGLAAPCSDVDIVIRGAFSDQSYYYGETASVTRILADRLQSEDWVQMLQAVERTAVPVVKFKTAAIPIAFGNRGNLIAVDITFENESHHGLNTCGLVRQFVLRWPLLKPLVLVLKQFLVEKGLNDAFVGGVSSYALVLMVAFVCRRNQNRRSACLGQLLIEFLQVFSSSDFPVFGISLNHLVLVRKPARFVADPCYIEDPLDPLNNVGRSCFGIIEVQAVFASALEAILSYPNNTLSTNSSVLGRVFATSHHNDVVRLVTAVWCPIEVPPVQVAAAKPAQKLPLLPSQGGGGGGGGAVSIEQWAEQVRDALLNAASRVQTGEPDECPMCDQKIGPTHVAARCGFMILAKQCPI